MPHLRFSKPGFGGTIQREDAIIGSTFSAGDLARNPSTNPALAASTQRKNELNLGLRRSGLPRQGARPGPLVLGRQSVGGLDLPISQFDIDFSNAQSNLRRDFVTSETERLFGPQGITSQTTAGGKPIPGQVLSRTPTAAQLKSIGSSFISPLDRLERGLPSGPQTQQTDRSAQARQANPTLVSGQGIRRRRLGRGGAASTLLTSDSDQLGSGTLLG